ncbi:MAG TPA: peptidyl-tRNA hydrolase Pth2 [Micromonosporaceae bacterium]|nr:peptidyl-tRNA hydrolase Pth2 [Micromonosporaceae bacterium]
MPVKLALVIRTDLAMGRGKIAAQAAHAAVAAVLVNQHTSDFAAWLHEGQPKVVLKVGSGDELEGLCATAVAAALPVEVIRDAGRTQVEPLTATCCAIGPAATERVDLVTGRLSLL